MIRKVIMVKYFPGWGPRRKQVCPDRRWTHEGGVVRSKLHSLETSKNAQKSEHERTKVCRTHESLDMNAQKSEHERTKVWWTHESLDMNARIFVRSWSDESPRIWSWKHKNSCIHVQTKKLTFYACRCPLKMKTPGFHESTNPHIKSFLREVYEHLYTNRRPSLFFAIVSKIPGVYLSALRIKWTSNKIFFATHSRKLKST